MSAENPEVYEDGENNPTEALVLLDRVKGLAVVDQPSLTAMNNLLLKAKAWIRRCDEEFDADIARWHEGHKKAIERKKRWTAPALEIERLAKPRIADYLRAEDEKRLEAERAAQRAKEIAAKEANDTADVAHELIQKGEIDEAEQVVAQQAERIEAVMAAAPVVPDKPIAPGAVRVTRWTWDRTDVDIALVPREYLMVDAAKVTAYVRAMKYDAQIPGIHIYAEDDIAVRGR